ncbi:MAG: dTMP kinase, partial [Sphingomonadales bacterium]
MARGAFITLEGGEGGGKSTQIGRLIKRLKAAGIKAMRTREPGGTVEAEKIRHLLVTGEADRWDAVSEALLNCAARRHHLKNLIEPLLEEGNWVISDRFSDSTMAYQGLAGGAGANTIKALQKIVQGDFEPDLTLVFDLPAHEGLKRADNRVPAGGQAVEDRFERKGEAFHEKLRAAYLEIAAAE